MQQKVIEHRGDSINDARVTENPFDFRCEQFQHVYRITSQNIVEFRVHSELLEILHVLSSFCFGQVIPRAVVLCLLQRPDLLKIVKGLILKR